MHLLYRIFYLNLLLIKQLNQSLKSIKSFLLIQLLTLVYIGLILINLNIHIIIEVNAKDFYKILQVSRDASSAEIRQNYLKLAKKLHPDRNKDDKDASLKFQELRKAFEVLSNEESRVLYDEGGEQFVDESLKAGGRSSEFVSRGFSSLFEDFFGSFDNDFNNNDNEDDDDDDDYDDFYNQFDYDKQATGSDIIMDVWLTYEELFVGCSVNLVRLQPNIVPDKDKKRKCNCKIQLVSPQNSFKILQMVVCEQCKRLTVNKSELQVDIKAGVNDGHVILLDGLGEQDLSKDDDYVSDDYNTNSMGDLILVVRSLEHAIFKRNFSDLYVNASISLTNALLGFTTNLTHLDGKSVVEIKRTQVTAHGEQVTIKGQGLPFASNSSIKGDLFVTFNVEFPRNVMLSDDDKLVVRAILSKYDNLEASNQALFYNSNYNKYSYIT